MTASDVAGGPASPEEARAIEEVAANAWPAEVVTALGGWRLRASRDRTWRASSVWPNADDGTLPVDEKIARAEAFYAARGAPARFQVCRAAGPPDLDARLAARGYALAKPSRVVAAETEAVRARTRLPATAGTALAIDVAEALDAAWLDAYGRIQAFDAELLATRRALFERIAPPRCHVRVSRDGEAVAVGVGVAERGFVGVYSLATATVARRSGAGTAALHAIATWGAARGAERLYLQVEAENDAALALYARAGLGPRYGYWYRVREVSCASQATAPRLTPA